MPTGLNNISLAFHLNKTEGTPFAGGQSKLGWMKTFQIISFQDDLIINPISMMDGDSFFSAGYASTYDTCVNRVSQMGSWLVGDPTMSKFFKGYLLKQVAPLLGIRESYRLVADEILTQQDCLTTNLISSCDPDATDFIALSDHAFDICGQQFDPQVTEVYGVPFGCLVPSAGPNNLLVACRGAGFDHVAASSCRLQKVMIQLGTAAAHGAYLAAQKGIAVRELVGEEVAAAMDMATMIRYYQALGAGTTNRAVALAAPQGAEADHF